MVQFLKAPNTSGEHFAAPAFAPMMTIKPMGREGFIHRRGIEPLDRVMAKLAMEEARSTMLSGDYEVVILDEINMAVHVGLVDVQELIDLIEDKPEHVELVLTGRYAHPEIIVRADVVLEMKKIKHHYDNGVTAREGIEY
jgi:cob(I)alamin adenosyltransferase